MKDIPGKNGGTLKAMEKGETLNPNGRPKKSFALLNDELKKQGYQPLTRGQLIEAYSLLLSIDQAKIEEIANDETQPLAIRLIIGEMTNEQTRGKALQDMRDYMFGRATQNIDHLSGGEKIQPVTIFRLPDDGRNG